MMQKPGHNSIIKPQIIYTAPGLSMLAGMIQFKTGKRRLAYIHLFILLFVAWVAIGCKSTPETPSNRLASVIIKDRTGDEIEAAIKNVFEKHDFELNPRHDPRVMVFEKKGSFMNGLVYGDWYSGGVWDRVKVYARELEPGRTLVDCDAFMVQEHDDPFFQSERAPYKTRRHVYQKLLEEVEKELKGDLKR
jgi:hypothetical protein